MPRELAVLSNVVDIQDNVKTEESLSVSRRGRVRVATPEDAAQVSKADGVIVGSAIVKRIASLRQDSRWSCRWLSLSDR
ncbi:MAG: tryptophan synthase subunit alpha [Nitrospira sp.]|nr:tryptophan synthase subunit alpha [Nitrospira sp.]